MSKFLAFIAGLFVSFAALATPPVYYVDGDMPDDTGNGLSWGTAFKTIHNSVMNSAGAVEYIKASAAPYGFMYLHDLTGTASQPILFVGVAGPRGAHPLVQQASSSQVGALQVAFNDHYIIINGIDFTNPTNLNPNGSASLLGSTTSPCTVDHITIQNSIFFNSGGGGISAEYMDYLTLVNNVVHDNGSTITNASPSGISLLAFCNFDTASGYHNYVVGNVVYNEFSTTGSTVPSDYNCFINDDQDHYQTLSSTNAGASPYTGATLVQGNLLYNCQGKGLHDWASQNLIVFDHNTDFMNCTVLNKPCSVNDGDLDALGATGHYTSNAVFQYNIVIAPNYAINISGLVPSTGSVTAVCNYLYGASGSKTARWDSSGTFSNQNYVATDPKLTNPTASAGSDFRPTSLTPALSAGC